MCPTLKGLKSTYSTPNVPKADHSAFRAHTHDAPHESRVPNLAEDRQKKQAQHSGVSRPAPLPHMSVAEGLALPWGYDNNMGELLGLILALASVPVVGIQWFCKLTLF